MSAPHQGCRKQRFRLVSSAWSINARRTAPVVTVLSRISPRPGDPHGRRLSPLVARCRIPSFHLTHIRNWHQLSMQRILRLRSLCAARMGTEDSIPRRVKSGRCSSRLISKMSNVMRSILLVLNANSARSPRTPLAARERSLSFFMKSG
jgi:hypothetical protein